MATIEVKRGDTARKIQDTLEYTNGDPIDLTGATVKLAIRRDLESEAILRDADLVGDPEDGGVEYQLVAEDTETEGTFYLEWHVTLGAGGSLRVPTHGWHTMVVGEDIAEP